MERQIRMGLAKVKFVEDLKTKIMSIGCLLVHPTIKPDSTYTVHRWVTKFKPELKIKNISIRPFIKNDCIGEVREEK